MRGEEGRGPNGLRSSLCAARAYPLFYRTLAEGRSVDAALTAALTWIWTACPTMTCQCWPCLTASICRRSARDRRLPRSLTSEPDRPAQALRLRPPISDSWGSTSRRRASQPRARRLVRPPRPAPSKRAHVTRQHHGLRQSLDGVHGSASGRGPETFRGKFWRPGLEFF